MNQMIGADVDAVRRLALQFEQSAQRLRAVSGTISHGVQVSAWVGPVSVRFRTSWDSEHSVKLKAAATALENNARVLRQNAAEQEAASASLAGNAGSRVVMANQVSNAHGGGATFDWDAVDAASWIHGMTDLATHFGDVRAFKAVGGGLSVLGIVGGLVDVYEASRNGDLAQGASGGVDVGLGVAALTVGAAGAPLVGALGVAKWYVDTTIPYTGEAQDALLNWKAQQAFGVDTGSMTPEQASQLSDYYAGATHAGGPAHPVLGAARVISDKMDQAYDTAVKKATSVTQPVINWIGDHTGWF